MAYMRSFLGRLSSFSLQKCWFFAHETGVVNNRIIMNKKNFNRFRDFCPCRPRRYSTTPRLFVYGGILTALGIKKEEKEEEEVDPLIHTMKLGILSFRKEDFDTAERILHLALKIAQEREDSQAVTYIYDILANVAFQKGDWNKAETLITDVMKRIISSGTPEDDNAVVELSLKLATVFDQQKLHSKAETGYQFCLETQQKKVKNIDLTGQTPLTEQEQDTLLLWAMSSDWYGRHLLAVGKLKEAQENFVKAYEMSKSVNGPLHHQTLVLLNDIGSVASLRENYSEAIQYLQKAIQSGKLGNSPDLPSFYCNLGTTYLKKGDYNEALKYCKEGFNLAKRTEQKEAQDECNDCLEELKKLGVK